MFAKRTPQFTGEMITQRAVAEGFEPRTVLAVSRFQGECISRSAATVEQRSGYERPNLDADPVP